MDNRNHHRMPRENANLVHKSKFKKKKKITKSRDRRENDHQVDGHRWP